MEDPSFNPTREPTAYAENDTMREYHIYYDEPTSEPTAPPHVTVYTMGDDDQVRTYYFADDDQNEQDTGNTGKPHERKHKRASPPPSPQPTQENEYLHWAYRLVGVLVGLILVSGAACVYNRCKSKRKPYKLANSDDFDTTCGIDELEMMSGQSTALEMQ